MKKKTAVKFPLVTIWTDGSCSPNPGKGGWCAIMKHEKSFKLIAGNVPETTSNRMELRAILEALKELKKPCSVKIFTDSTYAMKIMTGAAKLRKNFDLAEAIEIEMQKHEIQMEKVKSHNSDIGNSKAHDYAILAAKSENDVPRWEKVA